MRHTLVGLVLALLLFPSAALAQIRGEVETIGFGSYYRPDCWTPMVVRIRTAGLESAFYKLQVIQEDLDRDRPVYTRRISVDTSQAEQRFWMYFLPQPGGLPDARSGGTLDELRKRLRVQLVTDDNKPAGQIAQTQVPESLDGAPPDDALIRGRKLILGVFEGDSRPAFREYETAVGINEGVTFVGMRPRDLPESALAYAAVDAIVWFNADAEQLDEGGARRTAAIEQYVRDGGRLIVCQSADRLSRLAHMLPIEYTRGGDSGIFAVDLRDHQKLEPLSSLARAGGSAGATAGDAWLGMAGPFRMGVATPKPDAMVENRFAIEWPDGTTSPWLVRGIYGMGGVTWVAQDLGDPALTARTATAGWAHVWDGVFGWNNDTQTLGRRGGADATSNNGYGEPQRAVDIGHSLLSGMNHGGRGTALVLLAVVFFILYWIAAGPGSYFALLNWGKRAWSWVAFAAVAGVATLVTLGVVRLVLRGSPEVRHITVVRGAPGQPSIATSNIGLYIPDNGLIPVTLDQTAPESLAYVAPYPQHPLQRAQSSDDLPPVQDNYVVPVPDATGDAAPVVAFPYRSTLKKVQAKWVGQLPGGIDGRTALSTNALRGVEGTLTNSTGGDLRDVYIAYRNATGQVRILYRERWTRGTSFDFARDVGAPPMQVTPDNFTIETEAERRRFGTPRDGRPGGAPLVDFVGTGRGDAGWTGWWYGALRNAAYQGFSVSPLDDSNNGFIRALPVMALYDLLPARRDRPSQREGVAMSEGRFEILRRGARHLDMSQIVNNGQMLVLAASAEDRPLPFPFLVDGDAYGGSGSVLYEFVVPLDRTPPEAVGATQPASGPVE
jgi:hypothetical protein